MLNDEKKIKLTDLVEVKFLQEFQDVFAEAMGIASLTYDNEKPITEPSNFIDFCIKYTRGSVLGQQKCQECDLKWGKVAAEKKEPVIYTCHTGLTDFVVPVLVDGKHIASIFGGQILTKKADENHVRTIARQFGINEDEYVDAYKKIKIFSPEHIKAIAKLLFLVSNSISRIANKSYELLKKSERDKTYQIILETIRSTLDIDEIKRNIVKEIGKALNAYRCFIVTLDVDKNKFVKVDENSVYSSSPDAVSMVGFEPEAKELDYFTQTFKKLKNLITIDVEAFLKENGLEGTPIEDFYKYYNVKTSICIPIIYSNQLFGILIVQYDNKMDDFSDEKIEFIKAVANQVGIAFFQNWLFEKEKKAAQREALLRKITEAIRSSLNIHEIKENIVNEVGKALQADRCFFIEYDKNNDKFLVVKDEYLSSDNISKYALTDVNIDVPNFMKEFKKGNFLVIDNKKILINGKTKFFVAENKAIEKNQVNSAYGFPLFYDNQLHGVLAIHYINEIHTSSQDEIDLLQSIVHQTAVAIYQAELYETTRLQAEREVFYRDIIKIIRSSIDISETKKKIVNIIGRTLNADRCMILEYDKVIDKFSIVEDEYLSSDEIFSYKEKDMIEITPKFMELLKAGENIIIKDKKIISSVDFDDFDIEKEIIKNYKQLSFFAFPLFHSGDLIGALSISYINQKHNINEDETNLLNMISDQISIALYQAKAYERAKLQAEREALLRNITEKIRSSIDIEETLAYICEETIKLFKVQRSTIVSIQNFEKHEKFVIRKECKSSPIIRGLGYAGDISKISTYWNLNLISSGEILAIDNIEQSDAPDYFKKKYFELGVKSIIGTPIKKGNNIWGNLVLSEYENYRHWTDEEKLLLSAIADQIYIAINQAELYEKEKKSTDREKLLKDMVITVRSSLDIVETKEKIVNIIGKTLEADRCCILEYDKENDEFLPLSNEYLSSDNIQSCDAVNINKDAPNFASTIKMGKSIIINNSQFPADTVDQDFSCEKKIMKKYNVNSIFAFPLYYSNELLGALVLHYVSKQYKIGEDEIGLITALASQIAIAIYQAKLYASEKQLSERESTLRKTIDILRSTLDPEEIKNRFVEITRNYFDADRCLFDEYDIQTEKFMPFRIEKLKSQNVKSLVEINPEKEFPEFLERLRKGKNVVIKDVQKTLSRKNSACNKSLGTLLKGDTKSDYGLLVKYQNLVIGVLIIHFTVRKRKLTQEEFDFLKVLRDQVGTALYQAKLYQDTKKTARSESILRKVIEAVRSSLNINEVKKNVIKEICTAFNADRCYFRFFDKSKDRFLSVDFEYLSSSDVNSLVGVEPDQEALQYYSDMVKKQKRGFYPIVVDEEFAKNTPLERYLKLSGIKADYAMPIIDRQNEVIWLVLHYSKEDPKFDEDDKKLLETIAYQIDIAFDQIKLYNNIKKMAEREKISRNIIEILRSTLDRATIKHLFVKNLGEFFHADRVLFSEYSPAKMIYMPVASGSEYLSNVNEKSFVDYDWSEGEISEYIQPLLDKREIKISNWDEYIKENKRSEGFKSLFEDADVKSSYNMPILYQQRLMGFFCIEFTHSVNELSDEEINLIRSISRQAGIALYQAELYEKAQETAQKKVEFVANMSTKIKESLSEIIDFSNTSAREEITYDQQVDLLDNVNRISKNLLELMNEIS